ncbi:MAG: peptide ABC transporter substrate-binding protein [Clostridiales bacterium]|nr:peptide ABC transporter substrate-binding protein [Clostridiales bacterium]MDY5514732.1 peptide ABC transporter substrate-binding protein [Candidatus Ventricola sp.]
MKKLLALVLALVMVMALGMTALADGEIVSVMYGGGTPETMDPALNSASSGSNLIRLAFAGLMGTRVTDGVVTKEPELAESYTVSEDGTVYTFTLREGLKWSDGSDFYASDVVKSWNRAADEKLGASYGFLFDVIDGYGTGSLNVVADDAARTLTVTLNAPCAYFLELCGFTTFCPVKTELADDEGAWAVNPETYIGTGPFRVTSFKVDDVVTYEKNPYYWNADAVRLGGINAYLSEDSVAILAAYEADTISLAQTIDPAEFDRLNTQYPGELTMYDQIGTYYVLFNVHKDLSPEGKTFTQAENAKARYALGLMVNRQDLVDYVTMGGQVPATGFYPIGLGDGNTEVSRGEGSIYSTWYTGTATYSAEYPTYTEDQVEGIKILMDLGYSYTGSLETGDIKFTDVPGFEFSFNQNATNSAIVQYVQECWNLIGVNATINTEAWATLQTKLKAGDAEASRMGWVADFNDCVNFLEIFISNSGNNYPRLGQSVGDYTRYTENTKSAGLDACWGPNNDQSWADCYDALVAQIKNATDVEERAKLCAEAEDILMATGAVAPLYYYTNPTMVKSNVKNLAILPTGDIVWNYAYIEN